MTFLKVNFLITYNFYFKQKNFHRHKDKFNIKNSKKMETIKVYVNIATEKKILVSLSLTNCCIRSYIMQ